MELVFEQLDVSASVMEIKGDGDQRYEHRKPQICLIIFKQSQAQCKHLLWQQHTLSKHLQLAVPQQKVGNKSKGVSVPLGWRLQILTKRRCVPKEEQQGVDQKRMKKKI